MIVKYWRINRQKELCFWDSELSAGRHLFLKSSEEPYKYRQDHVFSLSTGTFKLS